MAFYDLLIIYLALGAPFGVYYFLQNRRKPDTKIVWLETLVNFVFWFYFAFKVLRKSDIFQRLAKNLFDELIFSDSVSDNKFRSMSKNLQAMILKKNPQLSLFEVREIFDRYVGLTLAYKARSRPRSDYEFYKISGHKNARLATICMERRNRQRLILHQKHARQDFLSLFNFPLNEETYTQIAEFTDFLDEFETQKGLKKLLNGNAQIGIKEAINQTGNLWKLETSEPRPVNHQTSPNLNLTMNTVHGRD